MPLLLFYEMKPAYERRLKSEALGADAVRIEIPKLVILFNYKSISS